MKKEVVAHMKMERCSGQRHAHAAFVGDAHIFGCICSRKVPDVLGRDVVMHCGCMSGLPPFLSRFDPSVDRHMVTV